MGLNSVQTKEGKTFEEAPHNAASEGNGGDGAKVSIHVKVVDEIAEVQQQELASQTVQKQIRHGKCRFSTMLLVFWLTVNKKRPSVGVLATACGEKMRASSPTKKSKNHSSKLDKGDCKRVG